MAKTKISEFSSTPANNTDIDSINIAEGCAPSGINDAIRELMAQLKDFQTGAQGDSFNGPIGTSTAAAGAFTTLSATGAITSTLATGTAPLVIASTTKVANLNVDLLDGADWASPAALGSTTPAAVSATTLSASGATSLTGSATIFNSSTNTLSLQKSGGAASILFGSNTAATAQITSVASGGLFFSTGDITQTEKMRITAAGDVGIGTSSPTSKLHVFKSSDAQLQLQCDNTGTVTIDMGGTTTPAKGGIRFSDNSGSLFFRTNSSTQATLDSSGNLGIGTSSPSAKLHVKVGTNQNLHVSTDGTTLGLFGVNDAVSAPVSMQIQGLDLRFNTGTGPASERMRLDSSGNLGLGVTPSAWGTYKAFQFGAVGAVAANTSACYFGNNWYTDGTNNKYINTATAGIAGWEGNAFKWYQAPSGTAGNAITFTQAMTLDASGNLGVGTTSPAGVGGALGLHVNGPSGASTSVRITNGDTGSTATDGTAIFVGNAAGAGATSLNIYNYESSPIALYTGGTERARIASGGNLLLGTTVDIQKLSMARNTSIGWVNAAGNGSDQIIYADSSSNLAFYTGASERARIDSSGNLLINTTSSGSLPGDGYVFIKSTSTQYTGHASGTASGTGYQQFWYNGASIGSITQNGTTGVLYNLTSDYRLKNNPIALTGSGEFIDALQPKTWDWHDGSGKGVGFIAHEFMEVAKYSGNGEKDAVDSDGKPIYQSIQPSSSEVMAYLVAEIQSLRKRLADAGL